MSGKSMSEEGDKDGVGDSPPPGVLDDAEACKGLDQEELTARVRCGFTRHVPLLPSQMYPSPLRGRSNATTRTDTDVSLLH